MDRAITIRSIAPGEDAWANDRYREIDFVLSSAADRVLVAELGGERVGLGRLVAVDDRAVELGGIWTAPSARGRGVARAMVEALLALAGDADVWCIPFADLAAFYRGFGLAPAPPPWPAKVQAKVDDCVRRGLPPVTVLARRR